MLLKLFYSFRLIFLWVLSVTFYFFLTMASSFNFLSEYWLFWVLLTTYFLMKISLISSWNMWGKWLVQFNISAKDRCKVSYLFQIMLCQITLSSLLWIPGSRKHNPVRVVSSSLQTHGSQRKRGPWIKCCFFFFPFFFNLTFCWLEHA